MLFGCLLMANGLECDGDARVRCDESVLSGSVKLRFFFRRCVVLCFCAVVWEVMAATEFLLSVFFLKLCTLFT